MMKKRVPDWLNSSLWSASPSSTDDDTLRRSNSKPSTPTPPSPVAPPVPEPPPPVVQEEPPQAVPEESINDAHHASSSTSADEDISRQAQLLAELSKKVINMGELRRLAIQGIPDGAGIRSTVWKLLLGYLPSDRGHWSSELPKKRSQYKHFKEELLQNPSVKNHYEVGAIHEP